METLTPKHLSGTEASLPLTSFPKNQPHSPWPSHPPHVYTSILAYLLLQIRIAFHILRDREIHC